MCLRSWWYGIHRKCPSKVRFCQWKKTFVRCGGRLRCRKMDRSCWWVEGRCERVVQGSKVKGFGLGNPKRGLVFMWDGGFRR